MSERGPSRTNPVCLNASRPSFLSVLMHATPDVIFVFNEGWALAFANLQIWIQARFFNRDFSPTVILLTFRYSVSSRLSKLPQVLRSDSCKLQGSSFPAHEESMIRAFGPQTCRLVGNHIS